MTLQHVVALRFGVPLTDHEVAEMEAGIASLSTIGEARTIRFGPDLTGERTRGYTHLLFMEFDDEHALKRYQQHPVHQQFAAWLDAHEGEPLGFDYHLDEQTCVWPQG